MICNGCGQTSELEDVFCAYCGTRLVQEGIQVESFIPLPPERTGKRRTKRKKRARRSAFRILGTLFLLFLLLTSVFTWVILSRFDNAQTLSKVPEEIQLSLDDGEGGVKIDTGPARLALDQSDQQEQSSFANVPFQPSPAASETLATPNAASQGPASYQSDGITVLLMGVDARSSEEIDIGVRPDSLSVLYLDPNSGSCRLLGIPRDSRVDLPGYGLSKINHALAVGGIPYQQLVVEQFLGIEIDHYGLVDFEGVVGVVDAVGGITVDNPYAFDHLGIHFAEGEIYLDGEAALVFSRYRYGPDGDFGRIDRQQLVMRALLNKLGGMDAVKAVPSLLDAADGHFKTDLSVRQMISIGNKHRKSCTSSTLETRSLTGTVETHPDSLFNTDLSYVILDPAEVQEGINWLYGSKHSPTSHLLPINIRTLHHRERAFACR